MKRTEIKRRPLADTVLAALEPEAKEYRETYGVDRLYFVVSPSGRKRWELRFKKPDGRWGWHGLGSYPDVTTKKAREKAYDAQKLASSGIDPVAHKAASRASKSVSATNTFRAAAEVWFRKKQDDGRAEKTLKGITGALENDILPALGDKSLDQIGRSDCAKLQASIEKRGAHNTAEKARVWVNQIFGLAIALGLTENNPASNLVDIAAKAPEETQYPHLLEAELPEFLRALRDSRSGTIVKAAAWLTVWTASRPGMVRWAEWSEFDLDKGLWYVGGAKMKMDRDHVVPLPTQAVEMIKDLHRVTGRSRYLFPSSGQKVPVISDATINKCFALIGYKRRMTGHGTRHTCSTLLNEHGWREEWIEAHLAHKKTGIKGVYDKAVYLRQRQQMVQWYADYLGGLEKGMTDDFEEKFRSIAKGIAR
ncbi:tyrosine-type recombinase/integrase [Pseudomonas alliivorans]|nr:tyrosine-type recombinase/integrase [Pseudomonas alliivorans]MEE5167644.1 tyrosine-type recombinase/integrase [Pseudomonas alliivorans]